MTTINNTDDLIEVLRTDPVVRSSVRRELLIEEVLALPNRVSALTDRIDAIVEDVQEYIEADDESLVYWLPLIERHLEPADTR